MALKNWRRTKNYPYPNTKEGWDSKDGDHLYIVKKSTMSIPYRIILNNSEIDSTGTILKARKIAVNYMRNND